MTAGRCRLYNDNSRIPERLLPGFLFDCLVMADGGAIYIGDYDGLAIYGDSTRRIGLIFLFSLTAQIRDFKNSALLIFSVPFP